VVNRTNGQGSEGVEVDEGCSRVTKDRAKWTEGKKGSTKIEVFIMGAMPNQQSKNQIIHNYRTQKL
jgi:hypothetical protein